MDNGIPYTLFYRSFSVPVFLLTILQGDSDMSFLHKLVGFDLIQFDPIHVLVNI